MLEALCADRGESTAVCFVWCSGLEMRGSMTSLSLMLS
jgi:hypothetical protein